MGQLASPQASWNLINIYTHSDTQTHTHIHTQNFSYRVVFAVSE